MEPKSSEGRAGRDDDAAGAAVDPLATAFDSVFDSVATLYRATGSVFHQLIGLRLRAGRGMQTQIEFIRSPEKAALLIERLRAKCDAVAHVRFAPRLPGSIPGLPVAERRSPVMIEIHHGDEIALAYCPVDPATRLMSRGEPLRRAAGAAPAADGA